MQEKLIAYAEKKRLLDTTSKECDVMKKEIEQEMEELGLSKETNEYGTYVMTPRKTWKYSKKVDEAESKIKIMKADEQESGVAVCTESKSLVYNDINNKKKKDE